MRKSGALNAFALITIGIGSLTAQDKRFVDVNGTTIAYRDVGQGEALLLLHGFGESARTWDPLVADLSANYRLVIPDLRGHGESTNPLTYFDHGDASQDMLELLDALELSEIQAVGFSSGGMVLLHMATTQPERLGAIALVGTTPYLPAEAREILRSMDPGVMPMAQLEAMGLVDGDTAQARLLLRQFVDLEDSYADVNFTPPLLSTITARTLVIHGDRDPFFPVSIPVDVYESIPVAFLLIFPNLGHEPFPADTAGQSYYTESLLRFFSGSWN